VADAGFVCKLFSFKELRQLRR